MGNKISNLKNSIESLDKDIYKDVKSIRKSLLICLISFISIVFNFLYNIDIWYYLFLIILVICVWDVRKLFKSGINKTKKLHKLKESLLQEIKRQE